jgi:hypothetical protein
MKKKQTADQPDQQVDVQADRPADEPETMTKQPPATYDVLQTSWTVEDQYMLEQKQREEHEQQKY